LKTDQKRRERQLAIKAVRAFDPRQTLGYFH